MLRALALPVYGWATHPAVGMWRGHTPALVVYGSVCVAAWRARGHADSTLDLIVEFAPQVRDWGQEERRRHRHQPPISTGRACGWCGQPTARPWERSWAASAWMQPVASTRTPPDATPRDCASSCSSGPSTTGAMAGAAATRRGRPAGSPRGSQHAVRRTPRVRAEFPQVNASRPGQA
ncbi:MAG: hypothetical protein M3425_09525 [Actinomycetota bacterium]|nr:hypothetical protein [Actinomycetota bacterium]MDQ3530169.1 hypothetical protein [Actinomycetota bacterium]